MISYYFIEENHPFVYSLSNWALFLSPSLGLTFSNVYNELACFFRSPKLTLPCHNFPFHCYTSMSLNSLCRSFSIQHRFYIKSLVTSCLSCIILCWSIGPRSTYPCLHRIHPVQLHPSASNRCYREVEVGDDASLTVFLVSQHDIYYALLSVRSCRVDVNINHMGYHIKLEA
jgi:hypothetical protein